MCKSIINVILFVYLDSINVIHKPMLDSDIKPSTILDQCRIIKKALVKLPEVSNIQSQYDDKEPKEVPIILLFILIK